MRDMRFQIGATLLELCVGLAITGALMGVSLPAWRELRRFQVIREARALEHRLRGAVGAAFAAHADAEVRVTAQEIAFRYPAGAVVQHRVDSSIAITLTAAHPQLLTIFGQGSATPGTIRLTSGSVSCQITLALRGRVRRVC